MKLGIAGAGMVVSMFLPEIMSVENIEVCGIYARRRENAQSLCKTFGIPLATDSFETLCCSDIDTVYVAVSNIAHFDFCKRALEAGLNVIVEKPITANAAEAEQLCRIAGKNGLFLFEAITTLHLNAYRKVLEWLPRIGDIRNAESIYTQRSSRLDAFLSGKIAPAFDPNCAGGSLMDLNVYCIHYIMGLFGKPTEAVYYPNLQNGIDTGGRMILQYPGFTAHCYAAKDCGGSFGSIIQGIDGCIKSVLPPNRIGEVILSLRDGTEEHFDDQSWMSRAAAEFRIFADAAARRDFAFCYETLEKSLAVSELMTQCRIRAGIHFPTDL